MDHTECFVRSEVQAVESQTTNEKVGDHLYPEQETYLCDSVEEFRALEAEIGVAARWTRPRRAGEPPDWVSRWRWKPEDGLGWPKHGNDIY